MSNKARENNGNDRDVLLALRYAARAVIKAEAAEQEKLTAIATALDHGASLDDLAEATGYSLHTLRRIAVRVRRGNLEETRRTPEATDPD